MNRYRLFFRDAGFPVDRMQLQVFVRDGGTFVAAQRGVTRNIYIIPVKRLPDTPVEYYFARKRQALLTALETGMVPGCTADERWQGKRCASFCPVAGWRTRPLNVRSPRVTFEEAALCLCPACRIDDIQRQCHLNELLAVPSCRGLSLREAGGPGWA